jgi:hypothetical protein
VTGSSPLYLSVYYCLSLNPLGHISKIKNILAQNKEDHMAVAAAPLILGVLQMLLAAEPAVVSAVHNILSGTGTADDLAVLGADKLAWQAIADKATAEIAKVKPVAIVVGP